MPGICLHELRMMETGVFGWLDTAVLRGFYRRLQARILPKMRHRDSLILHFFSGLVVLLPGFSRSTCSWGLKPPPHGHSPVAIVSHKGERVFWMCYILRHVPSLDPPQGRPFLVRRHFPLVGGMEASAPIIITSITKSGDAAGHFQKSSGPNMSIPEKERLSN
jgi:hypothetical protein